MASEIDLPDKDAIRQALYEVMDDESVPLAEKQRRALELGREYLEVDNGHIQRRNDDETDDVVASVGPDPTLLPEGTTLDRATTYCRRTVEEHSPVALSNVPEDGWADDPAYQEHGFDCYLGTSIFTDGDLYGSVCFISRDAREAEFTTDEKAFVELVARLIGRAIEEASYDARLERTERAKQRAADKYDAFLELVPDAVFLADEDSGAIEEVNEKAAELTGYATAELLERTLGSLAPADEHDRYLALLDGDRTGEPRERFADGTPLRLSRADGTTVPIELSLRTVTLDDQQYVQAIVRNISDRREREARLERSREFLRETQQTVSLGGWELSLADGELRVTDEVKRIFELPPEEPLTAEEALDFFHPEDRSTMAQAIARLRHEGEPFDLELRIETTTGETRWVRTVGRPRYTDVDGVERAPADAQASTDVHGAAAVHAGTADAGAADVDDAPEVAGPAPELTAIGGVFQEITGRKEREQDLRLKSQAIEESTVGITIGDATQPDVPIIYANDGFTQLTGYPKRRVLGENCRFLQGEETDEDTVDAIREAVAAEEPIRTQIRNYRADGTPFWNKLTIAPVTGVDADEVTHYVGIQEDVTGRKRRDRLIEVLNRVLRHNLRNDMTAVGGFADVIADRSDGEVAEMAGRIQSIATDLTELSEKAQDFQAAVRDQGAGEDRAVGSLLRDVLDDLRGTYSDTEFAVDVSTSEAVTVVPALRLALRELGENAAKHSGGPVRYETARTLDGQVAVAVSDDGPGLPDAEREVLETGRETPLEHGTGIGLWMVNWVVTGLGGTVTATVDDGTTVTVRLPPAGTDAGPGPTEATSRWLPE